MDIKCALAEEIADTMGATVESEKCHCGWPLLMKPNQGMPYCWNCTVNNTLAQRGKALLFKIQFQKPWIAQSRQALNASKAQAYDSLTHTQMAEYNNAMAKTSTKPKCPKCGGYITYYRVRSNQQHCRTCGHDFNPPKK